MFKYWRRNDQDGESSGQLAICIEWRLKLPAKIIRKTALQNFRRFVSISIKFTLVPYVINKSKLDYRHKFCTRYFRKCLRVNITQIMAMTLTLLSHNIK
jgi:hypothetical protein